MENSSSKVILSFVAGIAAGAAIGILLAPDTGENTRSRLKVKLNDFEKDMEDVVKKNFDEIKSGVSNLATEVRQKAEDLAKKGEEEMNKRKANMGANSDNG